MKSSIIKVASILKAARLFKNRSVLPILEDVFLNKDKAIFTDLETSVIIPYHTGITQCIPIEHFITVLTEFKAPVFTEDKGGKVFATEGKQKISLTADDPKNYPVTGGENRDNYTLAGVLTSDQMPDLLCALKFVSGDDLRPAMTTVQINKLIASTDAHRLVMLPMKKPFKKEVLIIKKVINLMEVFGGDWTVKISYGEKPKKGEKQNVVPYLFLQNTDGIKIYHRMIDARFPQWEVVVPVVDEKTATASIDTKELRKAIKTGLKFANKATYQGNITLKKGTLYYHTQDIDFGFEYDTSFPATFTKDIEIGFNSKFLDEFAALCGDTMSIQYTDSNKAIVIDEKYLLMPLMLNN